MNYENLSNEELVVLAQKNDKKARDELIIKNIPFINYICKSFVSPYYLRDDVEQNGIVGLIKCIKNFDVNKGYKFITYAKFYILKEVEEGYKFKYNCSQTTYFKIRKEEKKLNNKLSSAKIENILKDYECNDDTANVFLYNDKNYENIESELNYNKIIDIINSSGIKPKKLEIYKDIIKTNSFAEVGRKYNCSREYIRQINSQCNKIVQPLLKDFIA